MENYKKEYDELIEKVQEENRGIKKLKDHGYFYNLHHIVPIGIGGSDSSENIIKLTLEEHFEAHRLLMLIYKETNFAIATKNMFNKFGSDPKEFVLAQKKAIDKVKSLKVNLGRIPNKETRDKMSKSHLGNDSALGSVRSNDWRKMMSEVNSGNTIAKGTVHITNGIINKMIYLKDGIPKGFERGRTINKK